MRLEEVCRSLEEFKKSSQIFYKNHFSDGKTGTPQGTPYLTPSGIPRVMPRPAYYISRQGYCAA